jgi:hypothetical protein
MRASRLRCIGLAVLALLSLAAPKAAHASDRPLTFGIGPLFGLGGAAAVDYDASSQVSGLPQGIGPGLGGPYGSFGVMTEARIVKAIGVEFDYMRTAVSASAPIPLSVAGTPIDFGTVNVKFSQWHHELALLGKLAIPIPIVAPIFGAGATFVFPDVAMLDVSPALPTGVTIGTKQANWVYFTAVAGIELKLPIPKIDIRIPVLARFNWNVTSATCKANPTALDPPCNLEVSANLGPPPTLSVTYNTSWKYQVGATAGIAVYF